MSTAAGGPPVLPGRAPAVGGRPEPPVALPPLPAQAPRPAAVTAPAARRRLLWPDLARVVAILAVVVIHATGSPLKVLPPESGAWWTVLVADAASSWAVPVFAMLSGALLLRGPDVPLRTFYGRRLLRVGVPVLVWCALYLEFRRGYLHERLTGHAYWLDVLRGKPYFHLYFLFVVLGFYLLVPFLRVFVRHAGRRQLAGAAAVALALSWLDYLSLAQTRIGSETVALTFFLPWMGYFLAGPLVAQVRLTRRTVQVAAAAVLLAVAEQVLGTLVWFRVAPHDDSRLYELSKFSLSTIVMSIGAAVLLRAAGEALDRAATRRLRRGVVLLADASFAVYLGHPMVMAWLQRDAGLGPVPRTIDAVALLWAATVVVAFPLGLLLRRLPLLRHAV